MGWQQVDPQVYVSSVSAPLPGYGQLFSAPGYNQPRPPKNPLATASLVLGLLGLLIPLLALVAIILGHVAASGRNRVGVHLARGGFGLGYVSLGAWAMIMLAMLSG